jgi:hypothetical protein
MQIALILHVRREYSSVREGGCDTLSDGAEDLHAEGVEKSMAVAADSRSASLRSLTDDLLRRGRSLRMLARLDHSHSFDPQVIHSLIGDMAIFTSPSDVK